MEKFNISRLNTAYGVFRIVGVKNTNNYPDLTVNSIDMMGTDGWETLDITSESVIALVEKLNDDINEHLFNEND